VSNLSPSGKTPTAGSPAALRSFTSVRPSPTSTLLDLVEGPLDQVARAVQIRTEAERVVAIPSSSYPRSAKSSAPDKSLAASRLSWASPAVSASRTGSPLLSTTAAKKAKKQKRARLRRTGWPMHQILQGRVPHRMETVTAPWLPWQSPRPGRPFGSVQRSAIALLAKVHKLYRFCAGDHYAKRKSITDDR
jgi:hypothetical protein